MPGFFSNIVRLALNNLPGFPRAEDFLLGDTLAALGAPNAALDGATNQTIYYATAGNGGSDDTGDGSLAAPFATPQKAYDSIPRISTPGWYQIECIGGGTFPMPVLDKAVRPGTYVAFVGNRDTDPALTIAFGATPVFALVGTQAVRQRAAVGAYGFVVNQQTHWLELDYGATFPTFGGAVLPSTTPNLDAPNPRFGFFNTTALRPFDTIFEAQSASGFNSALSYPMQPRDSVGFHGIRFTGFDSTTTLENVGFFGCDIRGRPLFQNVLVDSAIEGGEVAGIDMAGGVIATNDLFVRASAGLTNTITDVVALANVEFRVDAAYLQLGLPGGVGAIDLEGVGGGFNASFGQILQGLDIWVDPLRTEFMVLLAQAYYAATNELRGSTIADTVRLLAGSQCQGVEAAAAAGGLTSTGGSEIVVGGNAGATFASLPATDVGAGAPQLCRAA